MSRRCGGLALTGPFAARVGAGDEGNSTPLPPHPCAPTSSRAAYDGDGVRSQRGELRQEPADASKIAAPAPRAAACAAAERSPARGPSSGEASIAPAIRRAAARGDLLEPTRAACHRRVVTCGDRPPLLPPCPLPPSAGGLRGVEPGRRVRPGEAPAIAGISEDARLLLFDPLVQPALLVGVLGELAPGPRELVFQPPRLHLGKLVEDAPASPRSSRPISSMTLGPYTSTLKRWSP